MAGAWLAMPLQFFAFPVRPAACECSCCVGVRYWSSEDRHAKAARAKRKCRRPDSGWRTSTIVIHACNAAWTGPQKKSKDLEHLRRSGFFAGGGLIDQPRWNARVLLCVLMDPCCPGSAYPADTLEHPAQKQGEDSIRRFRRWRRRTLIQKRAKPVISHVAICIPQFALWV